MATSRQVVVVNGVNPATDTAELYSINFSYSSMDRTWRRRPLPTARVAYFTDAAAAAEDALPAGLAGDVVYPQTIRLREDMTVHLRGTRNGVPGRWYQRYLLPAGNVLVPAGDALAGGRPARGFSHPWRFIAETAFGVADTFSHLGVYDVVDSRSQYYRLDVSDAAAAVLAGPSPNPWVDSSGQLFVRAVKFWWAAPLRIPDIDPVIATVPMRPKKKVPPSIFNPVTQLRIVKRGANWIAMHWDKRDDDLMPFDPLEFVPGVPADPPPPIRLTRTGQTVDVTVRSNVRVESGPAVPNAEFVWTGDAAAPVAIRLRSAHNVWRVRLGAIKPATTDQPAQAVHLGTSDFSQFRAVGDGSTEYRWKPTATELTMMQTCCTPSGSEIHGTSVWFEDVVGHVSVPDQLTFRRTMTTTAQPAQVPLGVPVSITVRARDVGTAATVPGIVTVTGSTGGATDIPFVTTFAEQPERVFDPDLRIWVTEFVSPTMTVHADDYLPANVALALYTPALRVSVDQAWLPIGRPAQVTVRTADATTGTPIAGRVILNGADIAATNTPFTYTSGATAPTGTVTAPHYPPAQIGWPALRPPRLTLSVAPYPVPLRVATSITVRAIDLDTGAPVDGTVTIGTTAVGRTNTPFAYTLTPNRIRVFDPETRTYTYETVTPTGNVTTAGYPTTPIDFGV